MNKQSLNEGTALRALYNGTNIKKIQLDENLIKEYNLVKEELELPDLVTPEFTEKFLMPEKYQNLSLNEMETMLLRRCHTVQESTRCKEELQIFEQLDKLSLIRYLFFLVDFLNKERFVWGVGRGSSVSVFIFYLIGLHKVNSVKYNLNNSDFFKTENKNG